MRNKKLISMLMLSAGFAACTQDELVDTPNVNNEVQGNLIEDVTFGVSLNENAVTRADYAGAWMDEEETKYSVFQHFYLEPDIASDGKILLTNNSELHGDMIGLCLTSGASAITNYPFYIAGYHSVGYVGKVDEDGNPVLDGDDEQITENYVYGLTDNSGLYKLALEPGQVHKVATTDEIQKSVRNVSSIVLDSDLEDGSLDIRKGIVRTNSAIMTGKYIAYYPFNEDFTEPAGIPLKGEYEMKDLFELTLAEGETLPTTHAEAVDKIEFSKYLVAVSQNTIGIQGGTRGGDINLTPRTSALTFILTNSDTENASEEIKRVTIRSANDEEAFILDGTIALDNLSGINATDATNLIGVSFPYTTIPAAIAADEENEVKGSKTEYYLTIPFFANPSVTGYIIEVYNTKGQIAQIVKKTASFGIGEAPKTEIDLAKCEFEDATRKIFNESDFIEEVIAGGSLELMKDIMITDASFTVLAENDDNKVPALEIISNNHSLFLGAGEINVDLTMDGGNLGLFGNVKMNGNVNAVNMTVIDDVVDGSVNVSEELVVLGTVADLDLSSLEINAKDIEVQGAKKVTFGNTNVTGTLIVNQGAIAEFNNYIWYDADETQHVETPEVAKLYNRSTVNAKDLNVTEVDNAGILNVSGWSFNAKTVNCSEFKEANKLYQGKMNVTTTVNRDLVYNGNVWNELNWNSTQPIYFTVNLTYGKMNINGKCSFYGKIVNGATVNLNAEIAFNGTLENKSILNMNANMSVQSGTMTLNGTTTVAKDAYLSGKSSVIKVGENAKFIKIANSEVDKFYNEITGASKFEEKYTEVKIQNTELKVDTPFTTDKLLTLGAGANLTVAEETVLSGIVVSGSGAATLTAPQAEASYITINGTATLNLGENSYINVAGTVTNNGTYNGVNSTVNCRDFTGYGKWTGNWTPNC